jgi:hypothetical protein
MESKRKMDQGLWKAMLSEMAQKTASEIIHCHGSTSKVSRRCTQKTLFQEWVQCGVIVPPSSFLFTSYSFDKPFSHAPHAFHQTDCIEYSEFRNHFLEWISRIDAITTIEQAPTLQTAKETPLSSDQRPGSLAGSSDVDVESGFGWRISFKQGLRILLADIAQYHMGEYYVKAIEAEMEICKFTLSLKPEERAIEDLELMLKTLGEVDLFTDYSLTREERLATCRYMHYEEHTALSIIYDQGQLNSKW